MNKIVWVPFAECPKSAVWVQGSTHGYVPPTPQKIVW